MAVDIQAVDHRVVLERQVKGMLVVLELIPTLPTPAVAGVGQVLLVLMHQAPPAVTAGMV